MLAEKCHLEGFPTKMKVRKKFVRLQCLPRRSPYVSQKFLNPKKSQNWFSNNLESVLKGKVDGLKHEYDKTFRNSGH